MGKKNQKRKGLNLEEDNKETGHNKSQQQQVQQQQQKNDKQKSKQNKIQSIISNDKQEQQQKLKDNGQKNEIQSKKQKKNKKKVKLQEKQLEKISKIENANEQNDKEFQQLKEQQMIQNKQFNEPQCMICYSSECIYKCLYLHQDIFVCSKHVHENQYMCLSSADQSKNKCPLCRHDEILKIDPIHRNQLKTINQKKIDQNQEISLLKQIEEFCQKRKQFVLSKDNDFKFTLEQLGEFKISNTNISNLENVFDFHHLDSVTTYILHQVKKLRKHEKKNPNERKILPQMVVTFTSVILELIVNIFENEKIYKNFFAQQGLQYIDPSQTIQNITKLLDTLTQYTYIRIENRPLFEKNIPFYILNLQIAKYLTQQFKKKQNKIFIDFYFGQFLEVISYKDCQCNKQVKNIAIKYLVETVFDTGNDLQNQKDNEENDYNIIENSNKIINNLDTIFDYFMIFEQIQFYFPFLSKEIQDLDKEECSLTKISKHFRKIEFQKEYHNFTLILDILFYSIKISESDQNLRQKVKDSLYKLIFDKSVPFMSFHIICWEISSIYNIDIEKFDSFNTVCMSIVNGQNTRQQCYISENKFDYRKFLIETTSPRVLDTTQIIKFYIDEYPKYFQNNNNFNTYINFFKSIHSLIIHTKQRDQKIDVEDQLVYQLLQILYKQYNKLQQKQEKQNQKQKQDKEKQQDINIFKENKFQLQFNKALHSVGKILQFQKLENSEEKVKEYKQFVTNSIIKTQLNVLENSKNSIKAVNGFVFALQDSLNNICQDSEDELNQVFSSDDDEDFEDNGENNKSFDSDLENERTNQQTNNQESQQQSQIQKNEATKQNPVINYTLPRYRQNSLQYMNDENNLDNELDAILVSSSSLDSFESGTILSISSDSNLSNISDSDDDQIDYDEEDEDEDWESNSDSSDEQYLDYGLVGDENDNDDEDDDFYNNYGDHNDEDNDNYNEDFDDVD